MLARHRTATTAVAALAAGSLVLSACGTDPAAGGPQQVLQERLDRGVSVEVTLEADPGAVEDPDEADELRDLLDRQADGPLAVLSRSGDGVARGIVLYQGAVEARLVDDTGYLHLDVEALAAAGDGDLPGPLAGLEDLASEAPDGRAEGSDGSSAAAGGGQVGDLFAALGDDGWIGVSGLTPERLAEVAGTPSAPEVDDQAVQDLLAERDLDDLSGLFGTYADVTGDGPWEVEVRARDLAAALEAVGEDVTDLAGVDPEASDALRADDHRDDHDPDELPATVGGITVEAADGVANRVTIDLATVAEAMASADEGDQSDAAEADRAIADLRAADARLVLDLVDVGDRTDTPADAAVVDVALLQALVSGQGEGFGLPDQD